MSLYFSTHPSRAIQAATGMKMSISFKKIILPWILYGSMGILIWAALGLFRYAGHPEILHGDAYDYHTAAKWLYLEYFRPHPTRMFGFPLLTGWIMWWNTSFEAFHAAAVAVNIVCWLLTGSLLYGAGRLIFEENKRFAFWPPAFFALQIGNTVMVTQAVTESLYTLLLTLILWCMLSFQQKKRRVYWKLALATFCFSLVVRPTAGIWLPIVLPALLWYLWRVKQHFLQNALYVCLCVLAFPGLQWMQMKTWYHTPVTSNIGLLTYYLYTDAYANVAAAAPGATWHEKGQMWQQESKRRESLIGMGAKGVADVPDWSTARDTMLRQCRQTWSVHPKELARSCLRNLVSNSVSGCMVVEFLADRCPEEPVRHRAWVLFLLGRLQNAFSTLLLLCAAGWVFFRAVFRRRLPNVMGWAALFGSSIILASSISFAQGDRFHMVLAPLSACWTAIFLYFVWKKLRGTS